ncbi:NAD-dependent protein deacetylase [Pseudoxanthomonas sacheonensis]|uniref:protein acetyllysine N-acetyltransferase n=1 Tax=Pseudoxanthomonas sacheonensis TaxID=443615 RepID=A0ABU1RMC6_9GAMM|nr:NAD-dependent protein deacetylase [Pseudoxanthomonas sacheonensis]MDR6839934.1 NAD-dependent SIR2 family protein deacetylase [Pseudoxanthomonas sacheonensis]
MGACLPEIADPAECLREWLAGYDRVFVLTGAGCSTASGIPDYRDARGEWKRTPPVDFRDFTEDPAVHARYWARSFIGWPVISLAHPNAAHLALAQWQGSGRLSRLLTQNVDGLHGRAGSRDVIDLHGRIDQVVCLDCAASYPRAEIQLRLSEDNPDWVGLAAATAPDGDADLEGRDFTRFRAPRCEVCGGRLKPDVVFFGENVPRVRYESARTALLGSQALLVVGSSLMVYSGFRFARMAHEAGLPIALLNRGQTRADSIADLKLEGDCTAVLPLALQEPRDSSALLGSAGMLSVP